MGKECHDIVLHWIQDRNKKPSVTCIRALIKPAGKIVISFSPLLPESLYDVYGELNPLNLGRLMSNYHFESRSKIEEMCTAKGFEIVESYAIKHKGPEFESIESTISFLWVTTQGVFDLQLVAKDKLSSSCARHTTGENSKPLKLLLPVSDFRIMYLIGVLDRDIGRCIGRVLVDILVLDRYSTEYRSTAHLMALMVLVDVTITILSVVYRSIIGYTSVIHRSTVDCRSSLDRVSIDSQLRNRSIPGAVTAEYPPLLYSVLIQSLTKVQTLR